MRFGPQPAALIGRSMQRHYDQQCIRFFNAIEADVPMSKTIHVTLSAAIL